MNDDAPFESPDYFSGEQFADEVMDALRESDVDMTESQDFNFYLYLETENDAKACAAEAALIGLEAKVIDPDDMEGDEVDEDEEDVPEEFKETLDAIFAEDDEEPETRWLCLTSAQMEPSQERFKEIGDKMIELARQYEGDFDGWEVNPDSIEQALDEMFGSIIDQLGGLEELGDALVDTASEEFLPLDFDELDAGDDLSPEAEKFLRTACAEFNVKQNQLREEWRFGECEQWGYEQDTGVFQLDFADGSKLLADGQIAGSYDPGEETWEWAWNNPNVDESVARDSQLLRELGDDFDLDYLRTGIVPTPGGPFPVFLAAIGVKATNSIGVDPGDTGDVIAFILLKNPKWVNAEE